MILAFRPIAMASEIAFVRMVAAIANRNENP